MEGGAAPSTSGAPGPSRKPPGPPPGGPPSASAGRAPPGPPPGGPAPAAAGARAPYSIPLQGFPGLSMPVPMTHAVPNFPPPLPPGWSEHRAPDGVTPYYYNSETKQSTYARPLMQVPGAPKAPAAAPPEKEEKKKKKEKPKNKMPVPGTEWTRVTTTEGNVFYFHKETKRSEWTVPEEIAEAVAALEQSEREAQQLAEKEARLERLREQERVRAEIDEERKRKRALAEERKRKAQEEAANAPESKVARKDEPPKDKYEPEGAEDEEAWMKAVAAEFAEADAAATAVATQEEQDAKEAEALAAKKVFAAPENVQVSPEEGRALFKALLIEKNISPFAPWDQSLPLFINDPRYVLLGSMKERQTAYEEYCRDAGRQRRLNKPAAAVQDKQDPERDYRALMRDEVTSTRTRWDDFRRKWRKDRRFYSFGRDDREREKAFKVHLRELGERKRADAERAEKDFNELLSETSGIGADSEWSVVKKKVLHDARYDAVGSSSLRAELFASFLKRVGQGSSKPETVEEAAERKLRERKERQQASLRDRESRVREQQAKVTEDVDKSRAGAGREEGERLFGSLLVDAIREDMRWEDARQILQPDPRFNHPSLRTGDKMRLFEGHMARLGTKKSGALHKLFETHAPALDTSFDVVYGAIADDALVARLGLTSDTLEERFAAWGRQREQEARREFDVLLSENSFVDFWGRMRKKRIDEAAAKVKEHDEWDEGEGMGEGGSADMAALAQQVDLGEIKKVLRADKRYRQFDHMPEVREQWLRDYLENLEGSKGSETIHKVGPA